MYFSASVPLAKDKCCSTESLINGVMALAYFSTSLVELCARYPNKNGNNFGKYVAFTNNGEFLLKSMKGNCFTNAGLGIGIIELAAKTPALPWDAPEAGPERSINITFNPARWSQIADETPTIPAPTITIVFIFYDTPNLILDYSS